MEYDSFLLAVGTQ